MRHTPLRCTCLMIALLAACATADESSPVEIDAPAGSALTRAASCRHRGQPPTRAVCLFGDAFADIRSNSGLQLTSETWIRSVDALTTLAGQQLLRAVQQSSHTDVTTPAEALGRVDQQEVRRVDLYELASGRAFVVFEYGVGDNSYGAFFASDSAEVVASIHDGDVLDCTVFAAEGGG